VIYIVGVGPGNPELLTIKAHNIITTKAEVVVYDRLIPKEILDIIPSKVKKIFAGKEKDNHTLSQDEINNELLKWHNKGKNVVRLKGGDPFIFGRGGEEIEFLQQHNASFEVVPGITTASSISSEFLIPLTDRRFASQVIFITGHKAKDKDFSINWQALASDDITIVIYMGLSTITEIVEKLLINGKNPNTKALAVEWSSTNKRKHLFSTLKALPSDLAKKGLASPTTIIIGRVVGEI
jgi:uroporphyrin-III C-methyltransferase